MNKARKALTKLALILSFATLGGCGSDKNGFASNAAAPGPAPLEGARIGGEFALTDQNGKTVHWSDFTGKYRIVYFGYTYCPDVCPVDLQSIMAGYKAFEKAAPTRAAKIQPIFISVDPERDTPAILKPWVAAFDSHLIGLTGSPDAIEAVKKNFAVVANKDGKPGNKDYMVSHTRTPYLFGPKAEPIALVPVNEPGSDADEGSPKAVEQFLDQWVK